MQKPTDAGFLVAKGRFESPSDTERKKLSMQRDEKLMSGVAPDDSHVIEMTRQIDWLGKTSRKEKMDLEKRHIQKLASAIFMSCTNNGYATVRAVGGRATYNALKAYGLANRFCKEKGIELCFDVELDKGNIGQLKDKGHVANVTAMLLKVKDFKNWVPK
jgi:stage V sporulation protein SpoVS